MKKKSIWIFGCLYLLFSFLLLIVVPLITKNSPWQLWHSIATNPQNLLLCVASIFGAIISIAIFKEYRDDGTELILVTKPINRIKATIAKFTLFFFFTFGFALISLINAPITFIFKDVTVDQVNSLVFSMMFANFIVLVIYGMLATLISLFANKIWTILGNVIVVVLLMIFSTVNALVIKTPAALAKTDNHAIVSVQYLANDNQTHSFAALTPTITAAGNATDISFTTIEQEKAQWQTYQAKSSSDLANFFDLMGQFNLLNNMGVLQDESTQDAGRGFGSNRFYNYQLKDNILKERDEFLPSYYVAMPSNFGSVGKLDWDDPKEALETIFLKYIHLITDQSIVMIGQSQVDTSSLLSTIALQKFYVARGNNGWSGTKNHMINYRYADLVPNAQQQDVFDKIIGAMRKGNYEPQGNTDYDPDDIPDISFNFGIGLKEITDFLNGQNEDEPTWERSSEVEILKSLWNPTFIASKLDKQSSYLDVLDETSLQNCNGGRSTQNFIHACLVGANKGLTNLEGTLSSTGNGKYKNIFWDSTLTFPQANQALMKTIAMFKLYAFQYLTKFISDLHQYANKTSVQIGTHTFDSQPILPLNPSNDGKYNMGTNIPETSLPWGILSIIAPSAQYDLNEHDPTIPWPDDNIRWANGAFNEPSYFTDPDILRARALLNWITMQENYGFNDAVHSGLSGDDPNSAFDADQNFNANLIITKTNFPLVYECLGATYTTQPKIQSWEIIVIWTLIGMIITSLSFTIYIRTDFK